MLAPRQHDPTERNHIQLPDRISNDGESLLANRAVRGNVIRRVDITLIDLTFWHELVDVDGAGALDLNRFYLLSSSTIMYWPLATS
jgi:hypothetical protein